MSFKNSKKNTNLGIPGIVDGKFLELTNTKRGGSGSNFSGVPVSATGGDTINTYTDPESGFGYKAHVFTNPGTFTISDNPGFGNIDIEVIAGGGGGGQSYWGAGGGAGGYRKISAPAAAFPTGSYPITIGAGGAANSSPGNNTNFGPGTAYPINATGGGRGGNNNAESAGVSGIGQPGGSGGGTASSPYGQPIRPAGGGNAGGYSPPEGNPGNCGREDIGTGGGGGAVGAGYPNPGAGLGTDSYLASGPTAGAKRYCTGGNSTHPMPAPTRYGDGGDQNNNGSPGIVIVRYRTS